MIQRTEKWIWHTVSALAILLGLLLIGFAIYGGLINNRYSHNFSSCAVFLYILSVGVILLANGVSHFMGNKPLHWFTCSMFLSGMLVIPSFAVLVVIYLLICRGFLWPEEDVSSAYFLLFPVIDIAFILLYRAKYKLKQGVDSHWETRGKRWSTIFYLLFILVPIAYTLVSFAIYGIPQIK